MAPEIPPGRSPGPPRRYGLLLPAALALALSLALLTAQRRLDFTVNEEGFLWYGAVATAHGDVPLRDFYSYDPGRYYWAAAWTPFAGEGLLGLRLATAAFGALGLFCGLLAARRAVANPYLLALLGVALTLWLLPRQKIYEPAIQMAGVLAATALIESPSRRRHLAAGALVGFGLFMGKNHGLYLGVAFLALIVLLAWRGSGEPAPPAGPALDAPPAGASRRHSFFAARFGAPIGNRFGAPLGAWLAGIVLGAAPLLAMLACVPGFARSYLDSILFFVHQGQTNFAHDVPWPWKFELTRMPAWPAAQVASLGLCFLLTAVFFAAGGLALLATPPARWQRHPLLAGAIAVGAVYTHYTFSRADLAHLGSGIHPLLLGLAALPAACAVHRRGRRLAIGAAAGLLIAALTTATALPAQPLYRRLAGSPLLARRVAGEELFLRPRVALLLDWAEGQAATRIPPGAAVLMAPNLPGLYPVLGRRAPVWDVYPIWPAAGPLDDRMLAELRRHQVEWAIFQDVAVDGRAELHFRSTHPETWRYLESNFQPVDALPDAGQAGRCILLQRAGAAPAKLMPQKHLAPQ
jgi:hypothetical protein